MTTTTIILTICLGLAIMLIVRLITIVNIWRKTCMILEKSCELQKETIENQQAIIDSYKSILSKGITGLVINDKISAN